MKKLIVLSFWLVLSVPVFGLEEMPDEALEQVSSYGFDPAVLDLDDKALAMQLHLPADLTVEQRHLLRNLPNTLPERLDMRLRMPTDPLRFSWPGGSMCELWHMLDLIPPPPLAPTP